jgi:hypothetical protein
MENLSTLEKENSSGVHDQQVVVYVKSQPSFVLVYKIVF